MGAMPRRYSPSIVNLRLCGEMRLGRVLLGDEPLRLARDDRKELVGILAAEGVPISYELCC
jgi:hypothetical protein